MSSKPINFIIDTTLNNTVTINKLIKRGDTLDLEIKVFENGVLKDLSGESISLILEKADKTNVEKSIVNINNPLKIKLDIQATNSIGFTNGEVFITDVDGNISSNTFVYEVVNDLSSRILESSKDDCETLDQLKKVVNQNKEVIENYKEAIQDVAGTTESAAALSELKKYIGPNLENLTLQNNKAATNKNNLDVANEQAVKNYDALNQLGDATNLAKKVQENTTQLSEKANQSDFSATNTKVAINTTDIINLSNSKVDKNSAGQVSMEMLTTEVKTSMTGGSVAVVGSNSVGLQQFTTTIKKDVGKFVDSGIVPSSTIYKISNGKLVEGTYSTTTGITMPVTSGDIIKATFTTMLTDAYYVVFGDNQLNVIQSIYQGNGSLVVNTDIEIPVPNGATVVCVLSRLNPPAVSKLQYIKIATIDEVEKVRSGKKFDYKAIPPSALSVSEKTNNLFDSAKISVGQIYIDGKLTNNSEWSLSDFINVESNSEFIFTVFDFIDYHTGYRVITNCFDNDKKYIGIYNSGDTTAWDRNAIPNSKYIQTLEGTVYIRLQFYSTINDFHKIQFISKRDFINNVYNEPYVLPFITKENDIITQQKILELKNQLSGKAEISEIGKVTDEQLSNWFASHPVSYDSDNEIAWYSNASNRKISDYFVSYANTLNTAKDLKANAISLKLPDDRLSHDATVQCDRITKLAYIVSTVNQTDVNGDSPESADTITRLDIVNVMNEKGMSINERYVVAKKDGVYNGITIQSGTGVPNSYLDANGILHIWFTAIVNDNWSILTCEFNIATKVLNNYNICQIVKDDVSYPFTGMNIRTLFRSLSNTVDCGNYMLNMNATIAHSSDGYHYACVGQYTFIHNGIIFRTKDYINWEFVCVPNFSLKSSMEYEGSLAIYNNNLYLALRQTRQKILGTDTIASSNRTKMLLATISMSNFSIIEEAWVPDDGSRPHFFFIQNELYLAHSVCDRKYADIIKIDKQVLRNSKVIQQVNDYMQYMSIELIGTNLFMIIGTKSNQVWASNGLFNSITESDVDTAFSKLLSFNAE